jgi:hypothetical protein
MKKMIKDERERSKTKEERKKSSRKGGTKETIKNERRIKGTMKDERMMKR